MYIRSPLIIIRYSIIEILGKNKVSIIKNLSFLFFETFLRQILKNFLQ
jgi:hypothetical protein